MSVQKETKKELTDEEKRIIEEAKIKTANKEAALKLNLEKAAAKRKRKALLDEKDYVPEKGTGKMFHLKLEVVHYGKRGKKVSNPYNQVMEYAAFIQWLENASSLNFSFCLNHDPSGFYTESQQKNLAKALSTYCKRVDFDTLEYSVLELLGEAKKQKGLNGGLKFLYDKRAKEIEASRKKQVDEESNDWNF